MVARAEEARAQALAVLGETTFEPVIHIRMLDSRDQMRQRVGYPATGWTDADSAMVWLVANDEWRPFFRHEIAHVVSLRLWGDPREPGDWIMEGLPTWTEGDCGGFTVDRVAATFLREGSLVPVDDLVHRFRELDDLLAYVQAGSLIGYVRESYGPSGIRRLWDEGARAGPAPGVSLEDVDRAWRRGLTGAEPVTGSRWERIKEKGCG